jgi:hypothetical protein
VWKKVMGEEGDEMRRESRERKVIGFERITGCNEIGI